jgi:transitional endoplasmic reticulum ATPase
MSQHESTTSYSSHKSCSIQSWDEIGGITDVKQQLCEFIHAPTEMNDIYSKFCQTPARGVLLYGPTGCGKTMLINALANEHDMKLSYLNVSELRIMENSYDMIQKFFDNARASKPCIIHLDQIDALNNLSDRTLNLIVNEMYHITKDIFIVGETNRPDLVASYFLRPDLLEYTIYVPLPNYDDRLTILKIISKQYPLAPDVDLEILAKVSHGFSGADLSSICHRAAHNALKDSEHLNPDSHHYIVTRNHFVQTIPLCRRSPDLRVYEMFYHKMLPSPLYSFDTLQQQGQQEDFDDDLYA